MQFTEKTQLLIDEAAQLRDHAVQLRQTAKDDAAASVAAKQKYDASAADATAARADADAARKAATDAVAAELSIPDETDASVRSRAAMMKVK